MSEPETKNTKSYSMATHPVVLDSGAVVRLFAAIEANSLEDLHRIQTLIENFAENLK